MSLLGGDGHCRFMLEEEIMHVHRLTTIAVRQRNHLVRDLLVATAGAVLMAFYISAFSGAMQAENVASKATTEQEPRIALVEHAR
jgi:hypothetical protein